MVMALFSTLFGAKAQETDRIKVLSASDFKEAIDKKDIQLVDVRTPQEFNAGAIQGAVNIDFFNKAQFGDAFEKFDKNEPMYIYCRSGNRSQKAAAKLDSLGFKVIYDLQGGYMKWPNKK